MKLRGQLILSHLLSMLLFACLIAIVSLAVLLSYFRSAERDTLQAACSSAATTFRNRLENLHSSAGTMATLVGRLDPGLDHVAMLAVLHDMLATYRIERIELFSGLNRVIEAYRWERGSSPALDTTWFPSNPRVAAEVADGRDATWVEVSDDGAACLKIAVPIRTTTPNEHRWLVVSEPIDASMVSALVPPGVVATIESDRDGRLFTWPAWQKDFDASLAGDSRGTRAVERILGPVQASGGLLQLDDGSSLRLGLLARPERSAFAMAQAFQVSILVLVFAGLTAVTLGSSVATRLLAPLHALIEGTSAMARGHLMVRLPTHRGDELGALMVEFNRMADEIRNTYLGVISTLAEVVEAKSHYTREHVERVERLTMATAEVLERRGWLGMTSQQRFLLSVAAILHDVGKIAIDNETLNSDRPLSPDERRQILGHTEVGALIVERMGKLERAAEIIRCAHEHFDGTGYPRSLRGEEIPLESRIILAVDAFDAMTMDRPYSRGRAVLDAIAEMRAEAGRQFDPVVVEALIEVVETKGPELLDVKIEDSGLYRAIHASSDVKLRSADSAFGVSEKR